MSSTPPANANNSSIPQQKPYVSVPQDFYTLSPSQSNIVNPIVLPNQGHDDGSETIKNHHVVINLDAAIKLEAQESVEKILRKKCSSTPNNVILKSLIETSTSFGKKFSLPRLKNIFEAGEYEKHVDIKDLNKEDKHIIFEVLSIGFSRFSKSCYVYFQNLEKIANDKLIEEMAGSSPQDSLSRKNSFDSIDSNPSQDLSDDDEKTTDSLRNLKGSRSSSGTSLDSQKPPSAINEPENPSIVTIHDFSMDTIPQGGFNHFLQHDTSSQKKRWYHFFDCLFRPFSTFFNWLLKKS